MFILKLDVSTLICSRNGGETLNSTKYRNLHIWGLTQTFKKYIFLGGQNLTLKKIAQENARKILEKAHKGAKTCKNCKNALVF